jgi:hypothetical protein
VPFEPLFFGSLLLGSALHIPITGTWNLFLAPLAYHIHTRIQLLKIRGHCDRGLLKEDRALALAEQIIEAELFGRKIQVVAPKQVKNAPEKTDRPSSAPRRQRHYFSPPTGADSRTPSTPAQLTDHSSTESPYQQILSMAYQLIGFIHTRNLFYLMEENSDQAWLENEGLLSKDYILRLGMLGTTCESRVELVTDHAVAELLRLRVILTTPWRMQRAQQYSGAGDHGDMIRLSVRSTDEALAEVVSACTNSNPS